MFIEPLDKSSRFEGKRGETWSFNFVAGLSNGMGQNIEK